jgi:alcohol dehydrogenase class IV
MGLPVENRSADEKAEAAMEELKNLVNDVQIPTDLKAYGCREEHLDDLAESAVGIRRLLDNNPKDMPVDAIRRVYASLL